MTDDYRKFGAPLFVVQWVAVWIIILFLVILYGVLVTGSLVWRRYGRL